MYQLNEEKMYFDIADGQAVVIDTTTGIYYGTSMLGSAVMERLVAGVPTGTILEEVSCMDGCPEGFGSALEDFVSRLMEKGILVTGTEKAWEGEPIQETALADGFALPLDEFSEVQDLILADPVHDVDVEAGWPVLDKGGKE